MPETVPILMYHAVADPVRPAEAAYTVLPGAFDAQVRMLAAAGCTTLTLGELVDAWDRGGPLPDRPVVLTFDDGFACLHDTVLPILSRHRMRATVFLVSGYLDRMARYDAALSVRARPMLARSQVLELRDEGVEIASHTVNHVDLRGLAASALHNELAGSRAALEDLVARPVEAFAFPRGLFDRRVYDAVRETGYRTACSTMPGLNGRSTDRLLLRRAQVGSATDPATFASLLRWGAPPAALLRNRVRARLIEGIAAWRGHDPLDLYLQPLRLAWRTHPAARAARPPALLRAPAGSPSRSPASGPG